MAEATETKYLYKQQRNYRGEVPLEFEPFEIVKETAAQYVVRVKDRWSGPHDKRINKRQMLKGYENWFVSPEMGVRYHLENREAQVAERQKAVNELEEAVARLRANVISARDQAVGDRDAFVKANAALLTQETPNDPTG